MALPFLLFFASAALQTTYRLEDLDLRGMSQGWGEPRRDRSVEDHPLTIGEKTFEHGLGSHAEGRIELVLAGKGQRFTAAVGVDADSGPRGTVGFKVLLDGRVAFDSGVMKGGDGPKSIALDLKGVKRMILISTDGGDGIDYDHADWCEASITMFTGKPQIVAAPREKAEILTPAPGSKPRLTGARAFGARPGNPFLFTFTATGQKPIVFSAKGLPNGLTLDSKTGRVTGTVSAPGDFRVNVSASNKLGRASREVTFRIGDTICLTPPMGWNSWNCWGISVSQEKVLSSAKAMAAHLKDHGWTYVNIDDGWQGRRGGKFNGMMANRKFPDMAGLAAQIHGMGLKAGIYSTPWVGSYGGHIGGSADNPDGTYAWQQNNANEDDRIKGNAGVNYRFGKYSFIDRDAKQYADWGIDYLKYDWGPWKPSEVEAMTTELHNSGRDIVYSLSNSAPFDHASDWARLSNAWRTTGDIYDAWVSVRGIWKTQNQWARYAGPGHWNDPDMLVVGKVGWGPSLHPTRLTPNEQYTHISLWCMLSAPLLLGCDLADMDPFTLNLLTNDEVLDIDQDPLGSEATYAGTKGDAELWIKKLSDGSRAVGIFNVGESPAEFTLHLSGNGVRARDLWRQKDLKAGSAIKTKVQRHGVTLLKVWNATSISL